MSNKTITIINIVSILPILLYPFIFIAGAMSFDAPGSIQSIGPWVIFLISTLYPIFIVSFVIASRKYQSLLLALIATIPFLIFFVLLFYTFIIGLINK